MEMFEALEAFASLAQETRLRVYKLVLEHGSCGVNAGKIAENLKIPDNTLSFHLSQMSRARLLKSRREGRSILYFADNARMNELLEFLQQNCCVKADCEPPRTRGRKIERKCCP